MDQNHQVGFAFALPATPAVVGVPDAVPVAGYPRVLVPANVAARRTSVSGAASNAMQVRVFRPPRLSTNSTIALNLKCPITCAIFQEPVLVVESGQTYELDAVEQCWLGQEAGKWRDPLSNQLLRDLTVAPNWSLRRMIEESGHVLPAPRLKAAAWPPRSCGTGRQTGRGCCRAGQRPARGRWCGSAWPPGRARG